MAGPWSAKQLRELAALSSSAAMAFSFRSVQSLALLDLTRDQTMAVKMEDVGTLNAKGQFAYALGKLLGGPAVDAAGGDRSLLGILMLLAGSFLGMARCRAMDGRLVSCFAASRFATAAVWTSAAVALKSAFAQHGLAEALSLGQVAMRLGASFGSLLGGLLLSRLGNWRQLLMVYAGLGTATGLLLFLRISTSGGPAVAGAAPVAKAPAIPALPVPLGRTLRIAAQTPKLWLLFASTTMITPTFDFVALLPQFLNDVYKMNDVKIGSLTGAFPLSAPPAILLAGAMLPKLTMSAKAASLLVAQSCSAMAFFLLLGVQMLWTTKLSKQPSAELLMPALVTISGGSAPALSCVPPDWIMRWGGPRAGLFAGLHDVPGNLLAMWIYSKVPELLRRGGWPLVLRLYALQVALGALCLALFQCLEAALPTSSSPFVAHAV